MSITSIPTNESERLLALYRYDVLDNSLEEELGAFVRLASAITGAEIAAVHLIDRDRQWSGCAVGMVPGEITRDDSLCSHTIAVRQVVHMPDCSKDSLFSSNPYVNGEMASVRMYAAAPLITPDGYAIGTICTFDMRPFEVSSGVLDRLLDLADQIVAALERRRQSAALAEANQQLDAFAATVAHDLRNPINNIGGYLDLLADKLESSPGDVQELLKRLAGATVRMEELLESVLAHSRGDSVPFGWDRVDLNRVAVLASENLAQLVESKSATVVIDDLPIIYGDAVQLSQLFQNLVANAINHNGTFNDPFVRVSAQEDEYSWILHVDDNGAGIPESERADLFEHFGSSNSVNAGNGIGLLTCKNIVKRHGAQIWAEEAPGGGARFSVRVAKRLGAEDSTPSIDELWNAAARRR